MNRILIVEDNKEINDTWVEYFEDLKYDGYPIGDIISFKTSDEANEKITNMDNIVFDIGIIDVRSYGFLNGLDLIKNVYSKIVNIIITTGYKDDYLDEINSLPDDINIYGIYYKKRDVEERIKWRNKYLKVLFE